MCSAYREDVGFISMIKYNTLLVRFYKLKAETSSFNAQHRVNMNCDGFFA